MMDFDEWERSRTGKGKWRAMALRMLDQKRDGIDVQGLRNHQDQSDDDFFVEPDEESQVIVSATEHGGEHLRVKMEAWIVSATAQKLLESTESVRQDEFLQDIVDACKDAPDSAMFAFSRKQFTWFSHLVQTSDEPCTLMRRKIEKIQSRGSGS